jgi:hypothetical protein
MKNIIIRLIAIFGMLVIATSSNAAGVPGKNFGGFKPGKKFRFTVKQVISTQSVGTKVKPKVPVPEGIPKFRKGQRVDFKIGKSGELKGSGFAIAFVESTDTTNSYAKLPTSKTLSPNSASVFKDSKGKPVAATMTFYLYRVNGLKLSGLSVNLVAYVLE